jgi:hypothetical protein
MTGMCAALALAAACCAQTVPVRPAQGERACRPDAPANGEMGVSTDAARLRLTPAQAGLFRGKIEAIAAGLRGLKFFNSPFGVRANMFADFCGAFGCGGSRSCARDPAPGRIWLNRVYFGQGRNCLPASDPENGTEAEVRCNQPDSVFSTGLACLPDGRRVAFLPAPWRQIDGVTLYFNQNKTDWSGFCILLTINGRPLRLPVTREQFLEALFREREAELAKLAAAAGSVQSRLLRPFAPAHRHPVDRGPAGRHSAPMGRRRARILPRREQGAALGICETRWIGRGRRPRSK